MRKKALKLTLDILGSEYKSKKSLKYISMETLNLQFTIFFVKNKTTTAARKILIFEILSVTTKMTANPILS